MFPRDVIESLSKDKKSVQILRGETSDHIFSLTIEPVLATSIMCSLRSRSLLPTVIVLANE
jgi:hypothetical protein